MVEGRANGCLQTERAVRRDGISQIMGHSGIKTGRKFISPVFIQHYGAIKLHTVQLILTVKFDRMYSCSLCVCGKKSNLMLWAIRPFQSQ